jgi:hypothetical protein
VPASESTRVCVSLRLPVRKTEGPSHTDRESVSLCVALRVSLVRLRRETQTRLCLSFMGKPGTFSVKAAEFNLCREALTRVTVDA